MTLTFPLLEKGEARMFTCPIYLLDNGKNIKYYPCQISFLKWRNMKNLHAKRKKIENFIT
jgi:hypothetical protein